MDKHLFEKLLTGIGEDLKRPGLAKTPERALESMKYLTSGYTDKVPAIVNDALFPSENADMVVVKNIEFYSLCEHHILPFFGKVHVAYIPREHVIGLSKIPRLVDVFARRLQIQETLTHQVAECILNATQADGVAVITEARHMCMMMRGAQKQNSSLLSSSYLGAFKESSQLRTEFLDYIKL